VACAGVGDPSLGIAGMCTMTGISGRGTQAGIEYRETPGAILGPSESRKARASAVEDLVRTYFQTLLDLNVEGALGSSLSFMTRFRSQISWEGCEQHFHLRVLRHGSLVDHNVADIVIGEDEGCQADVPTCQLVVA